MRTLADGFTGALMAVEGIEDAAVLVHGPGGCRVRHMVHSTAVFPRSTHTEGLSVPYFYGYSRVPATYLDEYDYINGAVYKLDEALEVISGRSPSLVVVIDSPGASLIGDDVDGALASSSLECVSLHMDESLFSTPMPYGHSRAMLRVMRLLSPPRDRVRKGCVNILGLSIMDKDWKAARDELVQTVESMGLTVLSTPGAGSPVRDLISSVEAEFNIVVCPELCHGLTEYYESMGVHTIRSPDGAPVGLDAMESWVKAISECTGADPSVPLHRIGCVRESVFDKFVGMRYNAVRIRGSTFSIGGMASVVRPLTRWLYSYLAMAPVAVAVDPGSDEDEVDALRGFLVEVGYEHSYGLEPMAGSDVVLCEGIEATTMMLRGDCRISIPIGHSSLGLDDIIPRPIYGLQGVLYILDEMLHGMRGS